MRTRIVLEGNAFYEIDEDCMEKKQEEERKRAERKEAENPDLDFKKNKGKSSYRKG